MNAYATLQLTHLLPRPGPLWGHRPMRPDDDRAPPLRRSQWRSSAGQAYRTAQRAASLAKGWGRLTGSERVHALAVLRRRLRREGLSCAAVADALAGVSVCAADTLGWTPRPTQLIAAAALLANRMTEMATGEGKTLAIALAAAVAALAGVPVHVVTANGYLAVRDAGRMTPLYAALGLRVASLDSALTHAARRAAYEHDVVYATAKDLAFDFLRDRQALGARTEHEACADALAGRPTPELLMRGLCMALIDEADSVLLDEAEVPLILSRTAPNASRRAFLWQALSLARTLGRPLDFTLDTADRSATLTDAGEERLAALAQSLGGPWQRPRYRREAVVMALAALHLFHRNKHYVVKEGAVELLDDVTGRVTVGRVWSRGLHTLVALKEGLHAPPETEAVAQTTFQRFFQRYWRLGGISGTLWEARGEFGKVYGARVVRVPLHQTCRRIELAPRHFDSAEAMWLAAAERVAALQRAGRPVLVGTDSVADSERLSALLQQGDIAHAVLDALHHADEAAIIAAAGRAGQVTVATRMAGRGTDIEIDSAARAAGGLHVLSCQHNASRRHDRQLAGRAGRHGDPGSSEAWFITFISAAGAPSGADSLWSWNIPNTARARLYAWLRLHAWRQVREECRRAALRKQLMEQDLEWERRLSFAGRSL